MLHMQGCRQSIHLMWAFNVLISILNNSTKDIPAEALYSLRPVKSSGALHAFLGETKTVSNTLGEFAHKRENHVCAKFLCQHPQISDYFFRGVL